MRIVFMGSPDFAVPSLNALVEAGHDVVAAYAQPPRPAGRGKAERKTAVQERAEALGIEVRTPRTLRSDEEQARFRSLDADLAVVAAYGLILPKPILEAPKAGAVNVHASLLPRWRGAAPIQRAILAGDRETGITIMQMDEGLDTGPIVLQQPVPILPETTAGELTESLADLGARLMVEALDGIAAGKLTPQPQPNDGVTYAPKIRREEARLDWRLPADALGRQVRAFEPRPGAWFSGGGERIRVLRAEIEPQGINVPPGTVLDDRLAIACGAGVFRPLKLQRPGRGALDADAFLRGFPIPAGTQLPCPATG
jgi:methionyl-tRNA formyltransferase